jgi:secondary thiamine-phosphate synthase enzyme
MASFQKEIRLESFTRGFHVITHKIIEQIPKIEKIESGILHVFIKHTSASLTVNENADITVRNDFSTFFDKIVPENEAQYTHTAEGKDDMPAHIKSSILGASVQIPITKGKLNLGSWQGIYLCEHRDRGPNRKIILTLYW